MHTYIHIVKIDSIIISFRKNNENKNRNENKNKPFITKYLTKYLRNST